LDIALKDQPITSKMLEYLRTIKEASVSSKGASVSSKGASVSRGE